MPISLKFGAIQVSKEEKQYYTPDNTPDNSPSLSRASAGIPLSPRASGTFLSSLLAEPSNSRTEPAEPSNSRTEPAEPSNSRTEPAEPSNHHILEKNAQPKDVCFFPLGACCSVGKREESQR
jgi:hypothetical protein